MLALLDDMKLDLANFRLIQLRPILKEHIVSYEREKFQAHLDRGDFTLEHAQSWLNPAVEQAKQVADERNPENIDSEDNKPKYPEVYADALLKLLTSSKPIGAGPLAETLRLDHVRLSSYQNKIQALTVVAAINMLLRNSFPVYRRDTLAHDKLRDLILVLLMDPSTKLEHIQAHVIETIRKCKEACQGGGGGGVVTGEERTMLQNTCGQDAVNKGHCLFAAAAPHCQHHQDPPGLWQVPPRKPASTRTQHCGQGAGIAIRKDFPLFPAQSGRLCPIL
jgi:hypothetical protein